MSKVFQGKKNESGKSPLTILMPLCELCSPSLSSIICKAANDFECTWCLCALSIERQSRLCVSLFSRGSYCGSQWPHFDIRQLPFGKHLILDVWVLFCFAAYSCHGGWEDNGTHFLITTPLSRTSHGARRLCFIYRESPLGGVHFSSSAVSCQRDISPGVGGILAFNVTSSGQYTHLLTCMQKYNFCNFNNILYIFEDFKPSNLEFTFCNLKF